MIIQYKMIIINSFLCSKYSRYHISIINKYELHLVTDWLLQNCFILCLFVQLRERKYHFQFWRYKFLVFNCQTFWKSQWVEWFFRQTCYTGLNTDNITWTSQSAGTPTSSCTLWSNIEKGIHILLDWHFSTRAVFRSVNLKIQKYLGHFVSFGRFTFFLLFLVPSPQPPPQAQAS